MFKNYLKIAFRNLLKYKGYSFINISGLAIGMACCVLILLYVQDELSYDRYHEKANRIYRVVEEVKSEGVGEESVSAPFPLGVAVVNDYPDLVETSVRFFNFQAPSLALEYEEHQKRFNEPRFFFADSTVFKVFSFEFIKGNPEEALLNPNSVVITETMAQKYFGNEEPMNKVLKYEGQTGLKVTGIIKDVPSNSHFQFDFLASFSTLRGLMGGSLPRSWYWNPCWTYLLLTEGTQPEALEAQFPNMVNKYFPNFIKEQSRVYLQPLTDIHLHSHLDFEIGPNSDISYVYIFSAVAVFILLIACINFMNLTTARSTKRSQEVGMRKALGAYRAQLIEQFLGESIVTSFIAVLVSLILIALALPAFNSFSGKEFSFTHLGNPLIILGIFFIVLFVGGVAGVYPAFFLSAFEPVKVLKGTIQSGTKGAIFRKILVVMQFAISIILIIGTGISYDQLNYLRNERLGFNKEQIVLVSITRTSIMNWYDSFHSRILERPDIISATAMHEIIGSKYQTNNYTPEGFTEEKQIPCIFVTHDFVKTFGMELVAGRTYSKDFPNDDREGLIINEATVHHLGWTSEEAIGKKFGEIGPQDNRVPVRIVGVVKDFNYASLHQPIGPFVIDMINTPGFGNFFLRYVAVRIKPDDIKGSMAFLQKTWEEFVPQRAFEYSFLDDDLDKLYKSEETLGKIFSAFAFLAIFIACLGLFALASFTTELRTKEIGVRKILGASVGNIVFLISKEFILLLAVANLLSWPLAYYVMNQWLEDFAYRVGIDFSIFIVASILAFIIALSTVSYQAVKASLANPADALRYE